MFPLFVPSERLHCPLSNELVTYSESLRCCHNALRSCFSELSDFFIGHCGCVPCRAFVLAIIRHILLNGFFAFQPLSAYNITVAR